MRLACAHTLNDCLSTRQEGDALWHGAMQGHEIQSILGNFKRNKGEKIYENARDMSWGLVMHVDSTAGPGGVGGQSEVQGGQGGGFS